MLTEPRTIQLNQFNKHARCLPQVPEHTWGVDIKTSLPDYRNWSNADFHAALEARTPMYGSTVYSWVRQKAYLRWALAALSASPTWFTTHRISSVAYTYWVCWYTQ